MVRTQLPQFPHPCSGDSHFQCCWESEVGRGCGGPVQWQGVAHILPPWGIGQTQWITSWRLHPVPEAFEKRTQCWLVVAHSAPGPFLSSLRGRIA